MNETVHKNKHFFLTPVSGVQFKLSHHACGKQVTASSERDTPPARKVRCLQCVTFAACGVSHSLLAVCHIRCLQCVAFDACIVYAGHKKN
jgi:hypothetical protein